jgi:hypothetical protein
MFGRIIKNATVQLPVVPVVKIIEQTSHTFEARPRAHLPREVAPDGNGGSDGNRGSFRILSGCA